MVKARQSAGLLDEVVGGLRPVLCRPERGPDGDALTHRSRGEQLLDRHARAEQQLRGRVGDAEAPRPSTVSMR